MLPRKQLSRSFESTRSVLQTCLDIAGQMVGAVEHMTRFQSTGDRLCLVREAVPDHITPSAEDAKENRTCLLLQWVHCGCRDRTCCDVVGHEALKHQWLELSTRSVDGRCVGCWPRANNTKLGMKLGCHGA